MVLVGLGTGALRLLRCVNKVNLATRRGTHAFLAGGATALERFPARLPAVAEHAIRPQHEILRVEGRFAQSVLSSVDHLRGEDDVSVLVPVNQSLLAREGYCHTFQHSVFIIEVRCDSIQRCLVLDEGIEECGSVDGDLSLEWTELLCHSRRACLAQRR